MSILLLLLFGLFLVNAYDEKITTAYAQSLRPRRLGG